MQVLEIKKSKFRQSLYIIFSLTILIIFYSEMTRVPKNKGVLVILTGLFGFLATYNFLGLVRRKAEISISELGLTSREIGLLAWDEVLDFSLITDVDNGDQHLNFIMRQGEKINISVRDLENSPEQIVRQILKFSQKSKDFF